MLDSYILAEMVWRCLYLRQYIYFIWEEIALDINWNLLAKLIDYNRKHGGQTDQQVLKTFLEGYKALDQLKDKQGNINVDYALNKINCILDNN